MPTNRKHLGARSEMLACICLLDQGFEVFRNISHHGMMDVIAVKDEIILKLDVKTASSQNPPTRKLSNEAFDAGVMILSVHPNGECRIVKPDPRSPQTCTSCSNVFTPSKRNQIYCSKNCQIERAHRLKRQAKIQAKTLT